MSCSVSSAWRLRSMSGRQLVKPSAQGTILLRYCQCCDPELEVDMHFSPSKDMVMLSVSHHASRRRAGHRDPSAYLTQLVRHLHNSALHPDLGDGSAVEARARQDYRASVPPQSR